MVKKVTVMLSVCLMVHLHGQGLSDTIVLDDVTVSVLPFGESSLKATGGLFAVKPDDMDLKFALTSTDLINMAPGIYMASGSYNTNRLVIRGVGSRTPYNSNRIRAYLDDIPLTSGDGVSTLEDLDLSGIGQLEILKGPSSALYGSGLGGIVRLNSPYPRKDGFSAAMTSEFGSFNTLRAGLNAMYKNQRFVATGGITTSLSEGYRENSNYSRTNLFLNCRYFGNRNTISFTLSLVDLFARIPSSLNKTDFESQPWKAAPNWLEVRGFEEYSKLLGGVKIESALRNGVTNHLVLFTSYTDPYESRPFNILDDRSANLGFREYLQFERKRWSFRAGLEYFHEWYRWKIYETENGSRGLLQSDQNETRKYANAFALVQWRPTGRLLIDGGINLHLLHYELQTNFQADSTDQSGSYSYPLVVSPRIGISFNHHTDHYLYASAGHGFSAPSLEETLLPEGIINTELKPETGWNLELGHRGLLAGGRIRYEAALYTIFLNNLLVTERITEEIFTGANAGKARNTGLELWVTGTLYPAGKETRFNAGATLGYYLSDNRFTDFQDDGIDYGGKKLPGIPFQKLNSAIFFSRDRFTLKLHHQFTGGQWMNDANADRYGSYQILHLQAAWDLKLGPGPFSMEFNGGVRNVTNAQYASMILVNAPSFGGNAPRYYYPGLPRQFHLGITLRFQ